MNDEVFCCTMSVELLFCKVSLTHEIIEMLTAVAFTTVTCRPNASANTKRHKVFITKLYETRNLG